MLRLQDPRQAADWLRQQVRGELVADSRRLQAGDGFIAWPGAALDGRHYVGAALQAGAAACLVEDDEADAFGFDDARVAAYPGLKAACGPIAAAFYGQPSLQLDVLAVTGTNGKTSTAWWLAQALGRLHAGGARPCGFIGTLGVGVPPQLAFTGLTTPDPVLLQQQFRRFADAGFGACAIEASSIGLAERRLDGTAMRVAIFTNFTQDHLDYHAGMQDYWRAKRELFDWPGLRAAVVNIDDAQGADLALQLQGGGLDLWTISSVQAARLQARNMVYTLQGMSFEVLEGAAALRLQTRLIGEYNVSNLLGVIAAMRSLGVPLADALAACADLSPVPGRMECVALPGQPLVAVDYAHTPDALDKALGALRALALQRGGKLWCVFGCGGDRDPMKRPLMAAVAEKNADQLLITSDNPRHEKPELIISQIMLGLSHADAARVQADRALAIDEAIAQADPADVVLIAGKGHEDYQLVAGCKLPFDDRLQARAALQRRQDAVPAVGAAS
jgi:UDP-N-acetylmuramoyl-L-alanyl-D-glutamate--2,6-diaminopimelate ligase